jgi:hypothetical protein
VERIALFEHLYPVRRRAVERLAISMVAVEQGFERLRINGLVGNDPKHHAGVGGHIAPEDATERGAGEVGLPAAGGHFHRCVGDRLAITGKPRRKCPAARHAPVRRQPRPSLRGEIGQGDVQLRVGCANLRHLVGLGLFLAQPL